MTKEWWREAVVYEVYVRSFADRDGDGVGDLAGVRSRLGYLRDLGVDALWLTPFYPSPQADHGYDVADHCDVDPMFGDLADFDALVADAHAHGLRVLIDVVPNHTSVAHPWFQEALRSPPGSPARQRYHFRRGSGRLGQRPPTAWRSLFTGPAWTRVDDGEWYLHLFDSSQPDLNWADPRVPAAFDDILRFWMDRGVDGFRVDVAGGLAKDPAYGPVRRGAVVHPHWDRPEVHHIYRRWNRLLAGYPGGRMAVAEAWGKPDVVARYARQDELHQVFTFELLFAAWSAATLRRTIDAFLTAIGAHGRLPAWVLSSHDFVRPATRYPDGRAAALLLTLLAVPGAMYLYQGDELGLPEVDVPAEARRDPAYQRSGGRELGRDGCRVPLPWGDEGASAGFSPAGAAPPWLPQPGGWERLAVQRQAADPASMLCLVRRALELRRQLWVGSGELVWLDAQPGCLAFTRERATCVLNAGSRPVRLARFGGQPVLSTAPVDDGRLPPASAVWLQTG